MLGHTPQTHLKGFIPEDYETYAIQMSALFHFSFSSFAYSYSAKGATRSTPATQTQYILYLSQKRALHNGALKKHSEILFYCNIIEN